MKKFLRSRNRRLRKLLWEGVVVFVQTDLCRLWLCSLSPEGHSI